MLYYPRPNRHTRKRVWQSHLNKVPAGEIELDLAKAPVSLSKLAMNGREISNSIRSAMTLAKHNSKKLNQDHLDVVLKVWKDSNPVWTADGSLISIITNLRIIMLVSVLLIGAMVAFGISSHGHQVLKNKDVVILYR